MRAILFLLLRLVVLVVQMAGLLAYFAQYLQWGPLASVLSSVLLVAFLPLVGTVLGFIGAIKVWLWPWWLALLVFLPGLALSLAALVGVGTAGLLTALRFRRRLRGAAGPDGRTRPGSFRGDTIEGEVLSSRVDNDTRD